MILTYIHYLVILARIKVVVRKYTQRRNLKRLQTNLRNYHRRTGKKKLGGGGRTPPPRLVRLWQLPLCCKLLQYQTDTFD